MSTYTCPPEDVSTLDSKKISFHEDAQRSAPMRHRLTLGLILFCLPLFGFVSCEDDQEASKPKLTSLKKNMTSGTLTQYHRPGNGLQEAPDWISSQDLNMMRRYTNKAVTGFRNGHAFDPKEIWIERGERGWRLILLESKLKYPTDTLYRGQRVIIPLRSEPSNELRQQVNFGDDSSEWRLPKSKIPNKTSPWVAQNAHILELLEWELKPFDPSGESVQLLGQATGRLVIYFKDDLSIQGWVAGRFEDVPIRFIGDPKFWSTSTSK
jgi:hypothetical protein